MRAVLPLLAAPLLLAGCTALDDLDRRLSARFNPPAQTATAPVVLEPTLPLPDRKPPVPERMLRRAQPAPAAAPQPEAAAAPDEPATGSGPAVESPASGEAAARGRLPATLVGLSADDLRSRFGAPVQVVEEAPGARWRYRTEACELDVLLFPRVESQGLFALDVSARGLPVEQCLQALKPPLTQ